MFDDIDVSSARTRHRESRLQQKLLNQIWPARARREIAARRAPPLFCWSAKKRRGSVVTTVKSDIGNSGIEARLRL
jgi:hypothetical protein